MRLDCSLDLMRRLPPQNCEKHLIDLIELAPDLCESLLNQVDQPLKVAKDKTTGREYLLCDYNRDCDSYRYIFPGIIISLNGCVSNISIKIRWMNKCVCRKLIHFNYWAFYFIIFHSDPRGQIYMTRLWKTELYRQIGCASLRWKSMLPSKHIETCEI